MIPGSTVFVNSEFDFYLFGVFFVCLLFACLFQPRDVPPWIWELFLVQYSRPGFQYVRKCRRKHRSIYPHKAKPLNPDVCFPVDSGSECSLSIFLVTCCCSAPRAANHSESSIPKLIPFFSLQPALECSHTEPGGSFCIKLRNNFLWLRIVKKIK